MEVQLTFARVVLSPRDKRIAAYGRFKSSSFRDVQQAYRRSNAIGGGEFTPYFALPFVFRRASISGLRILQEPQAVSWCFDFRTGNPRIGGPLWSLAAGASPTLELWSLGVGDSPKPWLST